MIGIARTQTFPCIGGAISQSNAITINRTVAAVGQLLILFVIGAPFGRLPL